MMTCKPPRHCLNNGDENKNKIHQALKILVPVWGVRLKGYCQWQYGWDFYYSVYFTNHCDDTFWQKTCQNYFFHLFETSLTMNIERTKSEVMLKRLQRYTLPSRFRRWCRTYFYIRRWLTPNMIKNTFRYQMCNK